VPSLINSVGNIGGFVGPSLLGYVHDRTQSFAAGLVVIGGVLVAAAALTLALPRQRANAAASGAV
jgi:MFS transporter, ACS family, tartrate transporter